MVGDGLVLQAQGVANDHRPQLGHEFLAGSGAVGDGVLHRLEVRAGQPRRVPGPMHVLMRHGRGVAPRGVERLGHRRVDHVGVDAVEGAAAAVVAPLGADRPEGLGDRLVIPLRGAELSEALVAGDLALDL